MRIRSEPILIGPCCVGKSTVSALLAKTIGLPRISMDELRNDYYNELGYCVDHAAGLAASGGFKAMYEYWKPFEIHAVERIIADHTNCVFDFGGGHSVFENPELFARAERALASFRSVVLLLPYPDIDDSLRLLRSRYSRFVDPALDINEHFIRHPSNARLATHVVYTEDRNPNAVCDAVIGMIDVPSS